jgi:hypothetical protein
LKSEKAQKVKRFSEDHENKKSARNLAKPAHNKECLAKTIQKQFPSIRLEASLLVNGCVESCPVHGNFINGRTMSGKNKSSGKNLSRQSSVKNEV